MSARIPPYIATIRNVREVSLQGTAEASFWQTHVASTCLRPLINDGQVEITISSTAARFLGWPFQEVAVALTLEPAEKWHAYPAIYLVHAFNSSRILGWMERTFFATPYYFAQASNRVEPALGLEVRASGQLLFQAQMHLPPPAPLRQSAERWCGAIYLPKLGRQAAGQRVFFADLSGDTTVYLFRENCDQLALIADPHSPVFGWLEEAHFQPKAWSVRAAAVHARSKTIAA